MSDELVLRSRWKQNFVAARTVSLQGIDSVERTRRDGEGYGDRGLEVSTLGDGEHLVFEDDEKAATIILLPF